jgi:hypothetical protein
MTALKVPNCSFKQTLRLIICSLKTVKAEHLHFLKNAQADNLQLDKNFKLLGERLLLSCCLLLFRALH